MNCHQILSGACNAGDRCFAVGSVEGIPFTAYAAGCNIVILASTFERVQIIPGAVHNYIRISSLDCSTDTGKIAAAYEDQVCIFEPTPLIHSDSSHGLEYRWVQTGRLQAESHIAALSWNLEGTRLLTGGAILQLWHQRLLPLDQDPSEPSQGVTFQIGGDRDSKVLPDSEETKDDQGWDCVWRCQTATPVYHMEFSPDGTLFATSGKNDRLVKIWYENKHLLFPTKSMENNPFASGHNVEMNYGFVYIAHPRALTHLSWRKTSKYMPKGSVSNMLVTSCLDNICRIWVETVLPDDGLVNMNQFDPLASQNPKFRTHRHKHRFMQRLKHMKTCFHIRRHAKHHGQMHNGGLGAHGQSPIPTLPSTYSVHDFHSYGYHGTGVTPGLHFHLAASINAETDIPLVPSMRSSHPSTQDPSFILHWLNNKEMHFSLQAEAILQELTRKVVEKEEAAANITHVPNPSIVEPTDEDGKKTGRVNKSYSQDESGGSDEHAIGNVNRTHDPTLSNTTSINSFATDVTAGGGGAIQITDSLDMKIDCLLRDWHHSPDLLFSVHPIDGSFLIWVVEWLDEYHPGSFRQAQVSFSTRIPGAFPLGDAMSMATTLSLYNTTSSHQFRDMVRAAKPTSQKTGVEVGIEASASPLPSVLEEDQVPEWPQNEDPNNEKATAEHPSPTASVANTPNSNSMTFNATTHDMLSAPPSPVISMVSKHSNGTLNLWQLTFADKSKFSQVLSIGHASRASGHRFRVNDITCHPVLPLLLTTSHHNIPDFPTGPDTQPPANEKSASSTPTFEHSIHKDVFSPTGFCSELILWRVDAVGPLSKSGGVSELARINSPEISAFSNVAWIPTLLPSTTLGSLSNSPSACFVASDGECLRVYQAVIDARTLLAEMSVSERRSRLRDSMMSLSTDCSSEAGVAPAFPLQERIKIVSQQSTARPGCVIQLDAIEDATHDWQNTQFLHVFQEQLITGERTEDKGAMSFQTSTGDLTEGPLNLMESQLGAMVDLQQNAVFEEPFYIVVLERTARGTTVHMWRIVIASQPDPEESLSASMMYVPDSNLVQDLDESEFAAPRQSTTKLNPQAAEGLTEPVPHVSITTTKVCQQDLPLPEGVEVVHASPAAGHLSSSSIYPACFAPYIIVTACSDSTVRFWKCQVIKSTEDDKPVMDYNWCEWEMIRKDQESTIDISGQPLNISAAYSGRIACAYKYGKSFTRPHKSDPESRFVNLCVAIYECESTGGSEWVLEDTIHLKNIHLPRIQVDPHLDLSYLYDSRFLQKKQRLTQVLQTLSHEEIRNNRTSTESVHGNTLSPTSAETGNGLTKANAGLLAVPSFSTLQSLRKSITENGNTCPLTQKHLVQLDWISKEDGSHILTVAVGSKVMLFTSVSTDLAQANMKAMKESASTNRPILRKASSLAAPHFNDEIRWMKLRRIDLTTADGLPPLPMQISWVRDGILVVGMDSEMHVYSQWKATAESGQNAPQEPDELYDTRNLRDEDLRTIAHESSQRRLNNVSSMPHLSRVSSINLQMFQGGGTVDRRKKSNTNLQAEQGPTLDYMPDYGLFEASRIACPVLPQYHPKQLMELLNSGKIRWVKAILAHLVRCISGTYSLKNMSGDDEGSTRQRGWSRSRTLSVSCMPGTASPLEPRNSTTQFPEELTLDYAEITSIPPLPLWTLLAAEKETAGLANQNADDNQEYNNLFDSTAGTCEENLDDLLECDTDSPRRFDRRASVPERQGLSYFGPRQGRLLSRLLTHTHMPGLSSLDQMHLLALADTVSTCNTDFAERFVNDAARTAIAKENLSGVPDAEVISTDSLDDCGLRFLLAMKHYTYLLRCLPIAQRAQFQKQGVGTNNLVWAFHSESEEELLGVIPSYAKGQAKWSVLKELGVGWWLRNSTLLKTCVEKLAKAAYQVNQDPLDAAIYYIAMKKKTLVWGLFRSRRDDKMTAFFSNDFTEDRWRKAALKNAFALLGKQRFEHAVAFFLLAGALRDALEVCLNKLEDLQLAMVIARLYESDLDQNPPSLKRLLYEEILGCDAEGNNHSSAKMHPDPFLRSMAYWILKEHSTSLNTLLQTGVGHLHAAHDDEADLRNDGHNTTDPNVFNFYVYLRTHPLLIKQHIASTAQERQKAHVTLGGFSYSSVAADNVVASSKTDRCRHLMLEDSITPLERQLYFTTAHGHFKAGCPALALEVLSKLPNKVIDPASQTNSDMNSPSRAKPQDARIDTGMLHWSDPAKLTKDNVDWAANSEPTNDEDLWGPPPVQKSDNLDFDWGAPVSSTKDDELVLDWDDNKSEHSSGSEDAPPVMKLDKKVTYEQPSPQQEQQVGHFDIMAQQLKFVACLKILMEELSTLATGYEVDGGQLRYQLYIWLEHEVDALRQLCGYSLSETMLPKKVHDGSAMEVSATNLNVSTANLDRSDTPTPAGRVHEWPTLHEILMAEKIDFEAKVQRAAKRKKWLKANETLLRTLLSYCSLHGASGGGLASVRMELILLLQELQQEKSQQQLLSPLPFPTTLPLLSATVAGNKTVIADPVRHLQSHAHDMLQTIIELSGPPQVANIQQLRRVFELRDLAVALSACIYQSLCDSDTCSIKNAVSSEAFLSPGLENIARLNATCGSTHLIGGAHARRRKYSTDEPVTVSTAPSKWPGVTNLRALLAREKDEDSPRLNLLLCESFVATYMALVVYALCTCDSHILYRLVGHNFSNTTWASLFGGGVKKLLRSANLQSQKISTSEDKETTTTKDSMWNAVTSLTKQRVRLNMKLLGQFSGQSGPNMKEDKPTYREQFVPPEMSMVAYFLQKTQFFNPDDFDYDSAESVASDLESEEEEEDVFADPLNTDVRSTQVATALRRHRRENTQHSNPHSYSWAILRLAIVRIVQNQLTDFLNIAGIEMQELPVSSPLIHGILRSLSQWQQILSEELDSRGPAPADYIPGCYVESTATGPAIHKYRSLLEKGNTPFSPVLSAAAPVTRLWMYLVKQESVQEIFIRAVFGKRRSLATILEPLNGGGGSGCTSVVDGTSRSGSIVQEGERLPQEQQLPQPVRIIHKEQDHISAFCLNQVNPGLLALATQREIQEMDISLLLESPSWLEDECEFDIMNLNKDVETLPSSGFLVIQTSTDKNILSHSPNSAQNYAMPSSPQPGIAGQSGRGASVMKGVSFPGSHSHRFCQLVVERSKHLLKPVLKHKVDNIKRMCSHPLMSLYLTGGQDGSVQLWEWGHQQVVCTPRPPGTFAKVTRARFSQHGNKFGIGDGDGNLSLWQVGLASNANRPFFTYQCHNKGIGDFVFLGSCSLLATAGHSSESKNVAMWDTLMPRKKSQVTAFTCHDQGASSLVYAPQHQLLISAGKKGDVCIFDVRQRQLRHRFQAHESPIKCLAMDPNEEYFVTGSADGDVKVWGLSIHSLVHSFPGEHARGSFFKTIGQGVTQLHTDGAGRLFSCGVDGSMKVRQLPHPLY